MTHVHAFTESGLGKAPFTLVGMRENAFSIGDGNTKAGGSCDHCGTGIRWEFVVRSSDGKTSTVGSSCIKKAGDKGLINLANRAKADAARAKRNAERMAAHERLMDTQRERNGGLTDWEVAERDRLAEEERRLRIDEGRSVLMTPLAEKLQDGKLGFRDSVASSMMGGQLPEGRGFDLVIEILAKMAGRRGSGAFNQRAEEVRDILLQAKSLGE